MKTLRCRRRLRLSLVLGAALAAVLTLVLGAGASPLANLAPNPGFEDASCGATVTCNWASTGTSAATRDTSQNHTAAGAASLKLDASPANGAAGSRSTCFSGVTQNTTYYFSVWYRTADTKVSSLEPRLEFWSNGTCSSGSTTLDLTTAPNTDGAWHMLSGSMMAPAGTVAAWVQLTEICVFNQPGCIANFDDVRVDTSPTAVRVASLAASRSKAGVDLTWRAPSTFDTLGFDVWRSDARGVQYSKLNRSLVLGLGTAYRYRDRTAVPGKAYVYRLQLVRPDGSRIWAANVRVRAARS